MGGLVGGCGVRGGGGAEGGGSYALMCDVHKKQIPRRLDRSRGPNMHISYT